MFRCIIFLGLFLLGATAYPQKEYSNWYFGKHCALTFNNGFPEPLPEGNNMHDGASISDSLGNLLFYTDGKVVYDRLNRPTPNGVGLFGGHGATQGTIIVKLPLSNHLYYLLNVFPQTILDSIPGTGFSYSVFDIYLNNGFGDIVADKKNIPIYLPLSGYALSKITAVRHKNNRDIWIVTRNYPGNNFYSYLLTPEELSTVGILSQSLFNLSTTNPSDKYFGEVSISPDGTKMAAAYAPIDNIEFGSFNTESGKFYPLFIFQPDTICGTTYGHRIPNGLAFSPDSKLLYLSHFYGSINYYECSKIHQFDVSVADSALVKQSEYIVGIGIVGGLQTGPDGKIYGGLFGDNTLSVINNPNQKGIFCNYSFRSVPLGTGNKEFRWALPQMLQKYFSYINYTVACINQPTLFNPNIYPFPDSVDWDFGDPFAGSNNTSHLINPSHTYTQSGEYQTILITYWPGGRSDTAFKIISVDAAPNPALGENKQICLGGSVTLTSAAFDSYLWSTGETQQSITVTDTGSYWVEVTNTQGCIGSDTTRVDYFHWPITNETNLILSPTTCGGNTGAIRGLEINGTEPITLEWRDNLGAILSNDIELYNLPVGNYYLWAADGNGCTNQIAQYTIHDAGDVLIDSVSHSGSYCGLNNGSISVNAISGLSDMLEYSIDNGNSWIGNEGDFTGLTPGTYHIRVQVPDGSGCQAVFAGNPVVIEDFTGPQADAESLPASGSNANGIITITATGFGTLSYSLNGGIPQSTGEFTGLLAGTYTWRVEDENGCFTEGSIEVEQVAGFKISAIAGNSAVCLGNAPVAPLLIENFTGVQSFTATLQYDATLVNCEGFRPGSVHPQLEANLIAEVLPASQHIVVTWSGSEPLTLPGTVTVLDLVFSATQAGNSFLTWDQAPAATWFTGEYGNIEPEFRIGELRVNAPPKLANQPDQQVCEGEMAWLTVSATGSEPFSYHWTLPDGSLSQQASLIFFEASPNHSGQYRIIVSDRMGCSDSTLLNFTVTPTPGYWFLQDTILFENQYLLSGPEGYASYLWNTGETQPEITITEEGLYTLRVTTHNQCAGSDSTFLKLGDADLPFHIPTAFTPNGDGLNDIFRPVVDYDRVRQFGMIIYDRWGKRIFETTNPAKGWDGADFPAGIYGWVITWTDGSGKMNKLRGSVTMVK